MKKALLSQCVFQDANDGRAKDGETECRWQCPGDWSEWSEWLAAGLHARNRWRLPVLLVGILFAHGRRTVTTWLRAAGVSDDLPRLLLLPGGPRTQDQIRRHAVVAAGASDLAAAGSASGGHRRHAHQAVRSKGRRGRHPPQSHARPGRPEVSLRTHLGDALAGRAASLLRRFGPAACGRCSTSAAKRWPRFRNGAAGRLPPSSCWPPAWSSGSLRSSNKPEKPCGSSSMAAT